MILWGDGKAGAKNVKLVIIQMEHYICDLSKLQPRMGN